jgi:hypothetical protein
MSEPILSIDTSEIQEGKLEELTTKIKALVEFVEANEPRAISYHVYFDDAHRRMTIAQLHPDSASLEYHMEVAASAFSGFVDLVTLLSIDLYGAPSAKLLDQMRRKADLLGGARLAVHGSLAGFARLDR